MFKPKIFPPNIYLHHGDLYRQGNYFKTINRFNTLGPWSLTSIDRTINQDSSTADFRILLSPSKRYSLNTSLEGSRNQTTISGNLFGIAINVGLLNRNFAKAAIQTNTNARFGIEFGKNAGEPFIQTQQISVGHSIYFPRTIPNMKFIPEKLKEKSRTVFSINAANTERKDLYNLTTFNASWGYEFQWNNKLLSIRIPNIEYSYLKPRQRLLDLFTTNPSLKNIFTDGFISSTVTGLTVTGGKKGNVNNFNTNLEESGLLTGFIHNKFLDTNLYRFIKLDAEFTRKIQYSKTAIALRFFAGVGYELNSTVNPRKRNSLPFFKQYFAGGPNSMRAWGIRKLGPGSVVKDFTGTTGIPDRYGDVQLEANAEYRFRLFSFAGIPVNGALFTDIGNVWLLKKNAGLPEEVFSLGRLGKDIAIGSGVGVRVDLSLFVIRLDVAYKVKDPSPSPGNTALQNKWFGYKLSSGTQFQLGISYPFIL
jgi:outer membrane protein assembly factor BamA